MHTYYLYPYATPDETYGDLARVITSFQAASDEIALRFVLDHFWAKFPHQSAVQVDGITNVETFGYVLRNTSTEHTVDVNYVTYER